MRHTSLHVRSAFWALGLLCAPLLAGCASDTATDTKSPDGATQSAKESDPSDPLEGFNRGVYAFNGVVDDVILEPVARLYRTVVPAPGRDGVKNFLANLTSPVILVNNILQGDVNGAFTTFWRFVLNTTVGFGGVYDFAENNTNLKYKPEDFGQTLGVWGVDAGPYLVLPIMGPSSVRDGTGRIADYFADPLTYLLTDWQKVGRYGATAVDARSRNLDLIDEIERTSIDPYATIRSAYLQRRESQVQDKGSATPPAAKSDVSPRPVTAEEKLEETNSKATGGTDTGAGATPAL